MLFTMFDVTVAEVEVYLIYISNVFKSKVIHPCSISLPTIDTQFIETVKEYYRLLIISIYRPPSANSILFVELSELLSIISGNGL